MKTTKADRTETAAFDVLRKVVAINYLKNRADAVMRAGRTRRRDGVGYEYPPELEEYYGRTQEEAERRMASLAAEIEIDVETVRGMCRSPQITFAALDLSLKRKDRIYAKNTLIQDATFTSRS